MLHKASLHRAVRRGLESLHSIHCLIVEIPIITHFQFVMWNDVMQIQHESI